MTKSAQKAAMALATQKVEAYPSLLAVDANDQSHIMRKLTAASSGANSFREVKADLCFGIVASSFRPCTAYLILH